MLIAVLAPMTRDIRWLLGVAWLFFGFGMWGLFRGMPSKFWRRVVTGATSVAIGGGLVWTYVVLKPSTSDIAKPLPAITEKPSAASSSAHPPKPTLNIGHRSTPAPEKIPTASALRDQLRRVVIKMNGCLARDGGETTKLNDEYWTERMDEKTQQELETIRKGVVADCARDLSLDLYGARNALKDVGRFDKNLDIDFGIATELYDRDSMVALMLRFEQIADEAK